MGCYYRWSSTGYHACPPLKNLVVLICLFLFFYFQSRRGEQQEVLYIDESRVMLKYLLPLNEVIVDFYDDLKSKSSGYARFVLDCEELLLWLLLVRTRQCESKTAEAENWLLVFFFSIYFSFDYEDVGYRETNVVRVGLSWNFTF